MTLLCGVAFSVAGVSFAETFQESLISVYNGHPALAAERARLRETDESYIQARVQGRPTVSLDGSFGGTLFRTPEFGFDPATFEPITSGTSIDGFTPLNGQLQIIQPIYQGGRVRALKNQAKAGILAAREGLRQSEQDLFLNAATAYSDVRRDEEVARVRRNDVRVLSRQLEAASTRFDVGVSTRTDIAQAQTRLAAAEIGLAQADAQLQISRSSFIQYVGHPPLDLQPVPVFTLPATLGEAIDTARLNNPSLIAASFNEEAADEAIKVAKSHSKPTVSLAGTAQGTRGQVGFIGSAESVGIAAQISVPIFSGGLNQSRVRAAENAKTRSLFETRNAERQIDSRVTQLWAQLDAAKRTLKASQSQVQAAKIAFEGVELENSVGTRTTLDVLNAEQELLNAELSQIQAAAGVETATFQLLAVMGGFDATALQLSVDVYDPAENLDGIRSDPFRQVIDEYLPTSVKNSVKNLSDRLESD